MKKVEVYKWSILKRHGLYHVMGYFVGNGVNRKYQISDSLVFASFKKNLLKSLYIDYELKGIDKEWEAELLKTAGNDKTLDKYFSHTELLIEESQNVSLLSH